MEDRLWNYIDGAGTAEERSFVEQLIATQQEWRNKYHELLEVHQLLGSSLELDEPSMRFTQNVMEDITRYQIAPATKNYINKKIIYGIGIFFLVMLAGIFIYGFGQVNWASAGNSTEFTSKYNLNNFDIGNIISSSYATIFIIVTAITGLMALDIYLGKKRKEMQSGSK